MKIDPYKHKERYLSWKASVNDRIPEVSEENSKIVFEYILDMENGLNVASVSKKGARSYTRLNNLKQRMIFLTKTFESRYDLYNITNVSNIVFWASVNDAIKWGQRKFQYQVKNLTREAGIRSR